MAPTEQPNPGAPLGESLLPLFLLAVPLIWFIAKMVAIIIISLP